MTTSCLLPPPSTVNGSIGVTVSRGAFTARRLIWTVTDSGRLFTTVSGIFCFRLVSVMRPGLLMKTLFVRAWSSPATASMMAVARCG